MMEKIVKDFVKFVKKHSVLLLSILGGVVLLAIILGFAVGRHGRGMENGKWLMDHSKGCAMEGMNKKGNAQGCSFVEGKMNKGGMKLGCPMAGGEFPPMAGPETPKSRGQVGCAKGEEKMQEHMCQSGATLESGASEVLLLGIDMKINNLTLIKNNMQSMAQRTATEIPTGQLQSLDDLINRFDAQRKLLETNPTSFCTEKDTWKALHEDMRKVMMEGVSGQVSTFREKGREGRGMMGWFR